MWDSELAKDVRIHQADLTTLNVTSHNLDSMLDRVVRDLSVRKDESGRVYIYNTMRHGNRYPRAQRLQLMLEALQDIDQDEL